MQTPVTIGIVTYNDQKYLEQALPSLLNQNYSNIEILIYDNNPDSKIKNWINTNFPTVKVYGDFSNIGFGQAHNFLMQKASGEFYLCYNSDMFAAPDYVEKLIAPFAENPKAAVTTGKILQWSNFPYSPDKITKNHIDTVGLIAYKSQSFTERGHGELDENQFNAQTEVWGASGASPMFKLSLVRQVEHSFGEVFDKNFFMYKEDIDLMFRLRWAGFTVIYQPNAISWHDRTVQPAHGFWQKLHLRWQRPDYVKTNSFLNHLIFVYKNWSSDFSLVVKIKTIFFIFKYSLYLLFFDPKILSMYSRFKKLVPELKYKRERMNRKISAKEMEAWFI